MDNYRMHQNLYFRLIFNIKTYVIYISVEFKEHYLKHNLEKQFHRHYIVNMHELHNYQKLYIKKMNMQHNVKYFHINIYVKKYNHLYL